MKNWILPLVIIGAALVLAYFLFYTGEKQNKNPYVYGAPSMPTDVPGPKLSELDQQATSIPFLSILSLTNNKV